MKNFLYDIKNNKLCKKSISKPIFTFFTVFIIALLYSLGFSMVKSNAESTCTDLNNSMLNDCANNIVKVETQNKNMQIITNSKKYSTLLSNKQISSSKLDINLESKSSNKISKPKNIVSSRYNHKINMEKTVSISSKNKLLIKKQYHKYLPEYFNYTEIDKNKLQAYLNKRNSLLAEEPYFSTIIATSKSFNLNPLILFAITGQEQSFVPKSSKNAYKIANNPFNIFHSWKDYNTDIADASRIVSRTIIHLSEGRPSNTDPFKWINRKYANDPSWSKGVRTIYKKLVQVTK